MSSIWGNNLKISLFGESHGEAIGVVLDGVMPGVAIDLDRVQAHMRRRAPGHTVGSTPRVEADFPRILSGMYNGKTTGTPLCAMIQNTDTRSKDYSELQTKPRPGHADLTGAARYAGANDPRGGGHFSGRIMAGLTFAGAVCMQVLEQKGVRVYAHIFSIADIYDESYVPDQAPMDIADKSFPVLSDEAGEKMKAAISAARGESDSIGGIVECMATGFPAGLGRPIFDNIESRLASILFAVPAVKGVEFGLGFDVARVKGSQNNDSPRMTDVGIRLATNNAGGVEGGISNGMPILFRCAFKPTPSIAKPQDTINLNALENDVLVLEGRHDACIVPRAVPIVEAAAAIALLDILQEG